MLYSDVTITPELRVQLEALEEELDVPIRVAYSLMVWEDPDDAERGITIAINSCTSGRGYHEQVTIDGRTFYDVRRPAEEPLAPIIVDDVVIGEVDIRTVHDYVGINRYVDGNAGAIAALVEAVRQSADPEFASLATAARRRRQREQLADYARVTYQTQVTHHRDQIDAYAHQMTRSQQQVARFAVSVREEQLKLDTLLTLIDNDSGERMAREWELLSEHPRIAELDFIGGAIVITTTDDLRLHHPELGESRWLGSFRIKLNPSDNEINLENLSTKRNGRDHPHVIHGDPCFGGADGSTYQLLAEGQLYVLFEVILQYLETLNPNDEYGRYGSYWFDEADERPLEVAEEAVPA